MKNPIIVVISLALLSLLCTGCHKDQITQLTNVKVHVNDFTISQEEMVNAKDTPVGSASAVQAITLAFYKSDGTEYFKSTQIKGIASTYGTTFGDFDLSLPMDDYTMVVIGYGYYDGVTLSLSSPTQAEYMAGSVRETFVSTQAVNITSTNAVNLNATLSRVNAKLHVISSDGKTDNADSVRMTFSGGSKAFNPTTGLATANTGFSHTVGISATTGNPSNSICYLLLATDEQTMTVTLDVLDASGNTISHKVVNNVPFQRNHVTKLTGSLYTAGNVSNTFMVNTSYSPDTTFANF